MSKSIRNINPSFRGWTKPGPLPDVGRMHDVELGEGETLDALCGHYRIFQLRDGHRFSTDDILTAWYATSWCPSAERALDLGCGLGTVAMMVAWRLRGVSMVGVEAQEVSAALARKSIEYNGLSERFDLREGDFRHGVIQEHETFDLITGSPPYWPPEQGVLSEHAQKVACRFELRGGVEDYCEVAARHLAPGGVFSCVMQVRPDVQLERVFDGARAAGLTIVRWRPIKTKETDEPLIGVFVMHRSEDLPEAMRTKTWEEPALVIRREDGTVHHEYEAVKLSFGFPP